MMTLKIQFENSLKRYLIIYDVVSDKRRHKVAKICESYGHRIQKSAFELQLDNGKLRCLKEAMNKIISSDDDIRIYDLQNSRCEIFGDKTDDELFSDVYLL